jgi:hypothetical protein
MKKMAGAVFLSKQVMALQLSTKQSMTEIARQTKGMSASLVLLLGSVNDFCFAIFVDGEAQLPFRRRRDHYSASATSCYRC